MRCLVYQPGLVEYGKAYQMQIEFHQRRVQGEIEDTLILLEHPPTITVGKNGKLENVLVSNDSLEKEGVTLFFTNRGGDVTYHGPGQLVIYPIIDLRDRCKDVHKYVHDLEEVVIRTVKDLSIDASRDENHAGVWVKDEELAAIGVRVSKWVTMHGCALNVKTHLEHFSLINPCGFSDRKATSITSLLSRDVPMEMVRQTLIANFAAVFSAQMEFVESI